MRATSPALPSTAEAIEFLDELRREIRFSDLLDAHIKEPIRFSVRGIDAPKRSMNPSPKTACWSFRGDTVRFYCQRRGKCSQVGRGQKQPP